MPSYVCLLKWLLFFSDPRFILGIFLFCTGFVINRWADLTLRALRNKPERKNIWSSHFFGAKNLRTCFYYYPFRATIVPGPRVYALHVIQVYTRICIWLKRKFSNFQKSLKYSLEMVLMKLKVRFAFCTRRTSRSPGLRRPRPCWNKQP